MKCSVEGTIFLPLLGQVEWSEKLEAAETAATCFVLEDFDVVKFSSVQGGQSVILISCLVIHQ